MQYWFDETAAIFCEARLNNAKGLSLMPLRAVHSSGEWFMRVHVCFTTLLCCFHSPVTYPQSPIYFLSTTSGKCACPPVWLLMPNKPNDREMNTVRAICVVQTSLPALQRHPVVSHASALYLFTWLLKGCHTSLFRHQRALSTKRSQAIMLLFPWDPGNSTLKVAHLHLDVWHQLDIVGRSYRTERQE